MPDTAAKRRARPRLVDGVIERLQQQVSLGMLRPGDRLPTETELTAAFGVSRTTIREAVAVLQHAGLLQVRQGDGTYVADWSSGSEALDRRLKRAAALEVYEVRRPLEIEAARLAAERRSANDVARMRELLLARDKYRAAGDVAGAVASDVEFHTAIAIATRNSVLVDVFRTFSAALEQTLTNLARDPATLEDTTELHRKLLDAIADGRPDSAARVAERLIDTDAVALRRALGATESPPAQQRARRVRPPDRAASGGKR